ncbi:AraC family transcriptional regulator [Sporocytophaga myxococcoides]|uniref:AraC family transcriptional regulator n=1 Tax=Sporocytophaga myxococcoides TaxID=153721 RepID=A0A098L8M4_9BACT|nr:AraC family transcriptional regulator [Sporocytophaga myxococcoides]GAL83166.1 AraC family transcriptional regulator [Sporocytophaga myxococcoides]
MKLRIKNLEPYKGELDILYPAEIESPQVPLTENIYEIGFNTTYGNAHDIYMKDLWLSYSNIALDENFKFLFQYDFSIITLQFLLSGNSLTEIIQDQKPLTYYANQHNILYYSKFEAQHEHTPSDNIQLVRIHVNPVLFLKLLPENELFDSFRQDIINGNPGKFCSSSLPLTPAMHAIIRDIKNIQSTEYYKRWMIEAKVIELLMLQFEQYEHSQTENTQSRKSLRKKDIEIMEHAKEIIMNNIQSPCSLIDLAHMVGTNEFYLKKKFKEVYGTTVFGYLFQKRMEEARKLLLSGEMNINQIALHLGYKNPNHFSSAFKKQYGYSPSELRKNT